MYERRHEPLLPTAQFVARILRHALATLGLIVASLAIGTLGYRGTEGLSWIDSFYNASMILTGMGPANQLETRGGKIFASVYALFSGIAFLTIVAVVVAPVVHRLLHRFHLQAGDKSDR